MPNNIDDIELRSEAVQEILTKVPHWMIRWGNVLFLCLILMLILISWFVKYPDVIISEAIITTSIPLQKEYAKTTGQLDALLVQNNQLVNPDQPLAIIENKADHKDVFTLKSILDTIQISSKSFSFPIDTIQILFLGEIESAYARFENNYLQYLIHKSYLPFSNETVTNDYSLSEINLRLESLNSQKELNLLELDYKKNDYGRNKLLFKKGIISEEEYEIKKLNYLQAKRNFKKMNIAIFQLREAIGNAQKTPKSLENSRTIKEMTLLKDVIKSFNQLKTSISGWELLYVLKSEINGRVSFLNYWNENQTVNQGDLVFTIVPTENSSFIAKLKSPSQNFRKIKVGQTVIIKLESYPEAEFGVLIGKVKNISIVPNKDGLYLIDASLPEELTTSYEREIEFKQEMSGVAEIITEDLRLIERFFYPFKEIADH